MSVRQHLKDSNTNYFNHAQWAVTAGIRLIWAGIASFIHAINPSWFPGTAAGIVIDLYFSRLHNHPNQEYQTLIQEYSGHVSNEKSAANNTSTM
jgi:hypothetical protein